MIEVTRTREEPDSMSRTLRMPPATKDLRGGRPARGPTGCKLSGGLCWSYYHAKWSTPASVLDIDHMVPLAETWDSGASQWTAQRREAYANGLGAQTSLVAVSAASNRSKADQDPAQWLPPAVDATCRYASEWIATELRWGLTIDAVELEALTQLADACPGATVTY